MQLKSWSMTFPGLLESAEPFELLGDHRAFLDLASA